MSDADHSDDVDHAQPRSINSRGPNGDWLEYYADHVLDDPVTVVDEDGNEYEVSVNRK